MDKLDKQLDIFLREKEFKGIPYLRFGYGKRE